MNVLKLLKDRFSRALTPLVDNPNSLLEMIKPAKNPRFGDYQANCAMPLANSLGQPPRQVAEQIVAGLELADICEPPEIAGPGFINLRLRDDWLQGQANGLISNHRLGVDNCQNPKTYIVDFSSPNVAKPLHVGHIRSTVIGDALCRVLRFVGHKVVSDNHLGDWGTQFGMLIL